MIQLLLSLSGPTIKSFTFEKCRKLLKIVIPSSIKEIKNQSFYGCTSLVEAIVPSDTTIEEGAFTSSTTIIKE